MKSRDNSSAEKETFARCLFYVGTRPCRKTCSKKSRRADEREHFADLGLAHYLGEQARGESRADDKSAEGTPGAVRDFRQLLYDWAMTGSGEEGKRKRTCETEERFTTMKPGSIIKDAIPIEKIVLLQAPYTDESLRSNLSDKAFQEAGDLVGAGIDTSKERVYKGAEAIKLIQQLTHHNLTTSPRAISATGESED